MLINANELDLIKALTWREELHARDHDGKFTTIRGGSKVVAKNGTAGKVSKVTDTHYHIEKDDGKTAKVLRGNVLHENDHKALTAPKKRGKQANAKTGAKSAKKAPTGAKSAPASGRKPAGKPADAGTAKKPKRAAAEPKVAAPKKAPKKAAAKPKEAPKAAPKKAAPKASKPKKGDIRSETQKNRKLAYDAGEKVGGARKDTFEADFKEKPSIKTLGALERDNPAVAQKLVVKKNLMNPVDFEAERKDGVDLPTALCKKAIFDRVAPKPNDSTPEARQAYVDGIQKLQRHFGGIKSMDKMAAAIREFSDIAYAGKQHDTAVKVLANADQMARTGSYINTDYYQKMADKGAAAKATMDFAALGDKLEGFFTSYKSRDSSLKTVKKHAQGGWDQYLGAKAAAKTAPKQSTENAKWERKAAAEHLRKGGRKTAVEKPEDLIKQFGVRGVEFGNWVNDSSGKYHLGRSAEAFSDLADVLGIDDKDVSLNKRLAIAFGARGKGGALAHYEPSRKVINMTKHGGAGSLAHEWGHALDNIMHQYVNNGKESLDMASQGTNGLFPATEAKFKAVMDAISRPAPGAVQKTEVNTEDPTTRQAFYYPAIRNMLRMDSSEAGIKEAKAKAHAMVQNAAQAVTRGKESASKATDAKDRQAAEKRVKGYERELREMQKAMPHILAHDIKRFTGNPVTGTIELPATESEYVSRMRATDGSRKPYYAKPEEMFARVFEAYVEDKLEQAGRSNNYLVHGTGEKHVRALGAPFPVGSERKHMFKAMEGLMEHISKGGALKKALEMERLGKSFNEAEHPRASDGRFTKLGAVAGRSFDHMDMYMNAMEDPEAAQELKAALKGREGGTRDKLKQVFDELGAGKTAPDYKEANPKPIHEFQLDTPAHSPESLTVTHDPTMDNHGSAPFGVGITVGTATLNEAPDIQDHILAHEVGHVISNLHPSLERHILDNPQDALGRTNLKRGRFEGVFGTHTPEESFAEAYGAYHTNPDELRERHPKAHAFVETVTQLLPHHINYLNRARQEFIALRK